MHSIKEHFLSPQRVRKEKSYIDYYKYLTPKGNKTKYQFYGDESRIYIPKIQVIGVDNEKREEVKRGLNIRSMSTTDDVPPKILTATISQGNVINFIYLYSWEILLIQIYYLPSAPLNMRSHSSLQRIIPDITLPL